MNSALQSRTTPRTAWWLFAAAGIGAVSVFVWLPESPWDRFLHSLPSKLFPPVFASAFMAGWVVSLARLKTGRADQYGTSMSHASVTGLITALVACFAAHAASVGPRGASLPIGIAAAFFALGMLPSAMFATLGAGFANAVPRWIGALVAGVMILIWPVGYLAGRLIERRPVVSNMVRPVVASPPKPAPRYAKPESFDTANGWKRTVLREDVVSDLASGSPLVLSHSERQIAFARSASGKLFLTVRHLYESDQDRAVGLSGSVVALAWSPDDSRLVFLSSDGAFSVCEPERGSVVPLPIPKVKSGDVSELVWWWREDVLVVARRGEPQVLSLDSLRVMSAVQHQEWAALKDAGRQHIMHTADMPPLHSGDKVRYSLESSGDARTLKAHDAQAIYGRVLAANLSDVRQAFSNRDGSTVFLVERERLRILYMGIRDAPKLRFIADSREDFPTTDTTTAAIKDRSIECVIASAIINPLNGKTVSGDIEHAKGLAHVIAADGKTATVWVAEERAPIRAGDVLMLPRASLPNGGALLSPTWFAVLTKADASQDIPRREVEKPQITTLNSQPDSAPAPAVTAQLPVVSRSPTLDTSVADKLVAQRREMLPEVGAPAPPPTFASKVPPLPPNASPHDRVKHFIETHHAKASDRNIAGIVADYGAIVNFGGKEDVSRDAIRQHEQSTQASVASLVETVDGPIAVTAQQNNRYHAEYGITFEMINRDGTGGQGSALIDMDVLLTSAGPKIVAKKTRVYKKGPVQKR